MTYSSTFRNFKENIQKLQIKVGKSGSEATTLSVMNDLEFLKIHIVVIINSYLVLQR